MNADFHNKIKFIQRELPKIFRRIPGVAKVEGLNFIHDNFDKQGFEDKPGSVKKWQKRKPPKVWRSGTTGKKSSKLKATKAGAKYLKDNKSRSLLIDKGKLRRSWDSDTRTTDTATEFTSSMPYAEAHNEGLQAGKPPGFRMPERKMIGDSDALSGRIEAKLDRMMTQAIYS